MQKKVLIPLICLAVVILCVLLGFANLHELREARFQVNGRVVDKATGKPLEGVDALLLLEEWPIHDKEELKQRFERNRLRWTTEEGKRSAGISRADGSYTARVSRKYGVKYFSVFGLGKPKGHPFKKAWLIYEKSGYQLHVFPVEAGDWQWAGWDWEKGQDRVPDVYLSPRKHGG
jgi:hypothetical protein